MCWSGTGTLKRVGYILAAPKCTLGEKQSGTGTRTGTGTVLKEGTGF